MNRRLQALSLSLTLCLAGAWPALAEESSKSQAKRAADTIIAEEGNATSDNSKSKSLKKAKKEKHKKSSQPADETTANAVSEKTPQSASEQVQTKAVEVKSEAAPELKPEAKQEGKTTQAKVSHKFWTMGKAKKLVAQDPQATPQTPAAEPKAAKSSSDDGFVKNIFVNYPARLATASIGAAMGMPVAVARVTMRETVAGAKDWTGESTNFFVVAPFITLSFPYACVSGVVEGPYLAAKNAWVNADDKPFTKDFFSLGDMN